MTDGPGRDLPATRFGPSLRRWRQLNRVKQAAAAELLDVSQATISRWESGGASPEGRDARRLARLLCACPAAAADRALLHLVQEARAPVHLVCDTSHRLLAVSPARAAGWRSGATAFAGRSLWRYATEGIARAEARLAGCGWYDPLAPDVTFRTERAEFRDLTIRAGEIVWTRIALADGRFARLVRDGARA